MKRLKKEQIELIDLHLNIELDYPEYEYSNTSWQEYYERFEIEDFIVEVKFDIMITWRTRSEFVRDELLFENLDVKVTDINEVEYESKELFNKTLKYINQVYKWSTN